MCLMSILWLMLGLFGIVMWFVFVCIGGFMMLVVQYLFDLEMFEGNRKLGSEEIVMFVVLFILNLCIFLYQMGMFVLIVMLCVVCVMFSLFICEILMLSMCVVWRWIMVCRLLRVMMDLLRQILVLMCVCSVVWVMSFCGVNGCLIIVRFLLFSWVNIVVEFVLLGYVLLVFMCRLRLGWVVWMVCIGWMFYLGVILSFICGQLVVCCSLICVSSLLIEGLIFSDIFVIILLWVLFSVVVSVMFLVWENRFYMVFENLVFVNLWLWILFYMVFRLLGLLFLVFSSVGMRYCVVIFQVVIVVLVLKQGLFGVVIFFQLVCLFVLVSLMRMCLMFDLWCELVLKLCCSGCCSRNSWICVIFIFWFLFLFVYVVVLVCII